MSTTHHTAIATGAAADAATINTPLGQLDTVLDDVRSLAVPNNIELSNARATYATLKARLDDMTGGYSGGNIATLTNGTAAAGQKTVTVDSTTGFLAGAYVAYMLVYGAVEYNLVDTVTDPTHLLLTTNIGTGGIGDNMYIGLISTSEYQAANAIPHAGALTLPQAMQYANGAVYNADAYGATGDGVTDDTAAIAAALTAIRARTGSKTKSAILCLTPGANYLITNSLNLTDLADVTIDGGAAETRITYADADATAAERVLFDCLGSARLTFRNFTVYGDTTNVPAVLFSFGRSTDGSGEDSGNHIVDHVICQGYWTVAAFYNVASELMKLTDVWILPTGPAGCKYGVFASGSNDESVGSEYATRSATVSMACVWIQNFNIGSGATPTAYIPIKLGPEAGSITIRDGYAYTYDNKPIIETTGNTYDLLIQNVLCEGEPNETIHFKANGGAGDIYGVTIDSCNLGAYSAIGVSQDAGTTIRGLNIQNCRGFVRSSSPQESAMTFAGAVHAAYIGKWWNGEIGAITFADLFNSRLLIANHTLTFTGSYKAFGTEIHSYATSDAHFRHFQTGVRVGTVGAASLAEINDIRTASKSWSPTEIADGAAAHTYVDLPVSADGTWFCTASYSGISTSVAWVLSCHAVGSAVEVVLLNKTGGALTPSGTLSVVAWKITAA